MFAPVHLPRRGLASLLLFATAASGQDPTDWAELAALPDAHGFAGAFAGVHGDALLVAGGANFPAGPPWEGGAKVWHDRVFALDDPDGNWREVGRLPRPLAYGIALTTPLGVLCIGGGDAERHHADVFALRLVDGALVIDDLPPLPHPLANAAGALVGSVVYVVGGSGAPTATTASRGMLALDLAALDGTRQGRTSGRPLSEGGWRQLTPLPGPGRIFAVAAQRSGSLSVFSGASLSAGDDARPQRTYLSDAWCYTPDAGWTALAPMPRPAVAAPSPAPAIGATHVLVFGGDDGSAVGTGPLAEHPGFQRAVLAHDAITDTWIRSGAIPASLPSPVTTPAVRWRGRIVLPSGEIRPGVRTPRIVAYAPSPRRAAFGWIDWTVVGLYLAGMLSVGFWFLRHDAAGGTEQYFRGGQRIPAVVAGLSIFATMLSALTFMGIPARAYATDMSWHIGQLPILLIAPLVAFRYLPFFRKLDLTSAYEFLEQRFDLRCRLFASLSFMLFHVGRIAIVLYLPALALAAVAEVDVVTAVVVIGALCVVYTVVGGITAVVWTDAIQAVVLMGGALLCLGLAAWRVEDGFLGIADIATRDAKLFDGLTWASFDIGDGTDSATVLFLAFFANSLVSYTSSQDVVQRYVTTRDIGAARRSLWVTMWMSVFGSLVFFALGVAIYAFYRSHPEALDPALTATDSILPYYIVQQLPTGFSGLLIAAIFAASQSTISSSLNSVATAYVQDVDRRLLRPGRDDRTFLRAAQIVVVIVGALGILVATWMAQASIESAFKTFNTLIGLTAGSLGGLFALGVFTRRTRPTAALLGALTGLTLVLTLWLTNAEVTGLLYAAVGMSTCFLVGYTLSPPRT